MYNICKTIEINRSFFVQITLKVYKQEPKKVVGINILKSEEARHFPTTFFYGAAWFLFIRPKNIKSKGSVKIEYSFARLCTI